MASSYGSPEWDQVLRGLVYEADAAKGTDEYEASLHRIIDAHAVWPVAEALWYLDTAAFLLAEREQEELAWYDLALSRVCAA